MVADWRQAASTAGGYPASFQDVACAIGVARAVAGRYGGNGSDVTLVGHSLGGWAGAVVTLTPQAFTPAAGTCSRTLGPLRPDAFVDLDGAVDEPRAMEEGRRTSRRSSAARGRSGRPRTPPATRSTS